MTERPILLSGPMVRAILDGRKTQTRRLVNERDCSIPLVSLRANTKWSGGGFWSEDDNGVFTAPGRCPYGAAGDRLWVRETWTQDGFLMTPVWYRASVPDDQVGINTRWRPSIFMPRWASRITLEVTDVRVQLLQEISEDDARSEGVDCHHHAVGSDRATYRASFGLLWDSINGKRAAWASNPWVWAISFERVTP